MHTCAIILYGKFVFNIKSYIFTSIIFLLELILNIYIIKEIPYTEIDWATYMQQIDIFQNNEHDYYKIEGDTGPCVYPAGFLYAYSFLFKITRSGKNIKQAQYVFMLIYLLNIVAVHNIYRKLNEKMLPAYALALLSLTSYRIHSIYVLRLFNDTIAILLLNIAINFCLCNYYSLCSVFISLAISIKMNILLYLPGYAIILLITKGVEYGFLQALIVFFIQLMLGFPFLLSNWLGYINRAFQFGRQFDYTWTVNWRFISPQTFGDRRFHIALLVAHIGALVVLFYTRYVSFVICITVGLCFAYDLTSTSAYFPPAEYFQKKYSLKRLLKYSVDCQMTVNEKLFALYACNFIGIVFSRSLHYQFYVWYYYTLPYLIWVVFGNQQNVNIVGPSISIKTDQSQSHKVYRSIEPSITNLIYKDKYRILLWGIIELCWNVYPSTFASSLTLNICHLCILVACFLAKPSSLETSCIKSS